MLDCHEREETEQVNGVLEFDQEIIRKIRDLLKELKLTHGRGCVYCLVWNRYSSGKARQLRKESWI